MVTLVNAVGSGSLGIELDLDEISIEFPQITEFNPKKHPGLYFRLQGEAPLITLYRTGKYIITGADSVEEVYDTRDLFLDKLVEIRILENPIDESFDIQNIVCTANLNRSVDLNSLSIMLGLEHSEYEPEQFPGLIYRPPDINSVIMVFTSGQIVITGCQDIETVQDGIDALQSVLPKIDS